MKLQIRECRGRGSTLSKLKTEGVQGIGMPFFVSKFITLVVDILGRREPSLFGDIDGREGKGREGKTSLDGGHVLF